MKRSNSSLCLTGSIEVMPSTKQITELAAEPRPWHRMLLAAREADDRMDGEEIGRIAQWRDQLELVLEQRANRLWRARRKRSASALARQLRQRLLRRRGPTSRSRRDIDSSSSRSEKVQRSAISAAARDRVGISA